MKNPKIKKYLFYIILFCILPGIMVLFSSMAAFSNDQGVASKIKKATSKLDKATQVEQSIPLPKNIVKATVEYQGGTFFTQARKNEIKRFQCSSCHNNKKVLINNAADMSHADIKVLHGNKGKPLSCDTCHNKDDRDFLVSSTTDKIDLDHVYDMCGQCHFRQKKDWIGGAHGKRVTYWAGERVVKNCTSCHNPHSPRFEKQWPKTYSVPLK
ncbi:MAG: hypothetical protein DRH34_04070 [Deltaproteobacteria bacterium]|nr:MAG: hypothetical protein DRH34_04070 [Deltaproteobacteria bacterium]RLC23632.1 MAG: hypothetical protein DRH93_06735 [Deltaproteobacteria bacterium]